MAKDLLRGQVRFVGLDLSGAKSAKSSLAIIEFFPAEKKLFLLEVYSGLGNDTELSKILSEQCRPNTSVVTSSALQLPPYFLDSKILAASMKWIDLFHRRLLKSDPRIRLSDFIPYTQRPVEHWLRFEVMKSLPAKFRFDIDECLGGGKAPLTARMNYLKKVHPNLVWGEFHPKLTLAYWITKLNLPTRIYTMARSMDGGAYGREKILEALAEHAQVFLYERDIRRLSQDLGQFDAFMGALTGYLQYQGLCSSPPKGFPESSGWILQPNF